MNANAPAATKATTPATRPFYWSVRRELWENRSITIAPLVVAALALFGLLINTVVAMPNKMRTLPALDPAKQLNVVVMPYSLAASVILLTGFIVGAYYCLDALYGERRDRSILFWKSMPVSDLTTVLSKMSIPFAVLPLLTFTVALATQLIMLLLSSAILLGNGVSPGTQWTALPLFQMTGVMLYGITVHALWFAPIYGWLLLVSAWARRAVFLWAVLPFFAIFVVERLALGTSWFASVLKYRMMGAMVEAFAADAGKTPITQLSQLEPVKFLGSPNLWLGLAFAGACLAAAVWLRRNREPI
jgi:ABC-2 type transport system permease protein